MTLARRTALGEAGRFALLAVALSWAAWAPLLLAGSVVTKGAWPTHLPGLMGPAVAALILAARGGPHAWADLVARLRALPPGSAGWALALAPLPLLAAALASGGSAAGLGLYSGMPPLPWWAFLPVVLVVNGLGEELGWRGYLLPRLQAVWGPVAGTAATGALWAAWHLPMFVVLETYRAMGPLALAAGFGLGLMAGSFVLAHIAAVWRGGVLGAVLWHTGFNLGTATALGGPAAALLSALAWVWALALLATPAGRRALAVPPVRAASAGSSR